jgi:hypothetical protein
MLKQYGHDAESALPHRDYDGRITLGGPAWDAVSDAVFQPGKVMDNYYDSASNLMQPVIDPYYSVKAGYDTWKSGCRGALLEHKYDESEEQWATSNLSAKEFINSPFGNVFTNGMMNDENSALSLGEQHTNKMINEKMSTNPFLLTHNPTSGFIEDLTECALEKLIGQSNVSRQISSLMVKKAEQNQSVRWFMHSQGTLMGTSALRSLANDHNIMSWSNLEVEYHGSPTNYYTARYNAWKVGAQWGGMQNNPGDAVGNVFGFNTPNRGAVAYSMLKVPSLFFDVKEHPSGYLSSEHTIYHDK